MANAKTLAVVAIPTHFTASQLRRRGCVSVAHEGGFIIMQSPYGQVYKTRDADLEHMANRYCKRARDYANQMIDIHMRALERVETAVFSGQAAMLESMSWKSVNDFWGNAFRAKDRRHDNRGKGKKPRGKSISQKRADADKVATVIAGVGHKPAPGEVSLLVGHAGRKLRATRKAAKAA